MSPHVTTLREPIAALCKAYGVQRLDVFGSAARDDFDPSRSDFDAVVSFGHHQSASLRHYLELKTALERLLGREVDLVELDAMPDSRLKRMIASSKVPLYAAQG